MAAEPEVRFRVFGLNPVLALSWGDMLTVALEKSTVPANALTEVTVMVEVPALPLALEAIAMADDAILTEGIGKTVTCCVPVDSA